jgi:hypothetical protein
LDNGQLVITEENTLVIENPTHYDTGDYSCTAATKLDSATKTVRISIQDVPNPVYGAYVSKCDEKTATATINFEHLEPKSAVVPVKEFWIRYMADPSVEQSQWRVHPVPVSAVEIPDSATERHNRLNSTINLKPYGKYVFQVIARNSVGDSAPFKVKGQCNTAERQPSRNPSNVHTNSSSPNHLTILWDAMPRDEWNGQGFGYEVQYRPVI